MTELEYYRLKSGLLALQLERQQFTDYVTQRHQALLTEAGLDPTKHYQLDEQTKTAVEAAPAPHESQG